MILMKDNVTIFVFRISFIYFCGQLFLNVVVLILLTLVLQVYQKTHNNNITDFQPSEEVKSIYIYIYILIYIKWRAYIYFSRSKFSGSSVYILKLSPSAQLGLRHLYFFCRPLHCLFHSHATYAVLIPFYSKNEGQPFSFVVSDAFALSVV